VTLAYLWFIPALLNVGIACIGWGVAAQGDGSSGTYYAFSTVILIGAVACVSEGLR
jgi:hypothetical protein